MTDTIIVHRAGPIARLVLNNPERHNSLGEEQLLGIQSGLTEISQDRELRVLIVTGAGNKTFCAGASLRELGAGQISGNLFQDTTDQLAALAIPTICALNGNVFGGGVELALSCDFRIGITGARLRVPAAAIGLCYPLPGIRRYVERMGVNVAKRILVAAEEFNARQLAEIGFLDHLVEPHELEARTQKMANEIAALAPLAVRAMKDIIQQAAQGGIDLEHAGALAAECLKSADLQEGFAAQRDKRPAQFTGR